MRRGVRRLVMLILVAGFGGLAPRAQDNYEIQVYGSEMDPPGTTTLELHSNFTAEGRASRREGVVPTDHAMHETLEVAHGFTDWFETGVYFFSTIQPDGGWQFVGSHIRPRVTVPERWHWPVGLSLGQEAGYQRRQFSENTWTYELQPIIDKKIGPWYLAFNPTFDRTLHGVDVRLGWEFSPNAKVSYDFTKKIAGGLEYYGSLGPATEFYPLGRQYHQFFPSIDLDVSPKWELNFGVGFEPNHASDHLIVKFIIGRRFTWGGKGDSHDSKDK
ncbi:MAG: hypothetical protein WCC22_15325 [Terriglobales bacterium]